MFSGLIKRETCGMEWFNKYLQKISVYMFKVNNRNNREQGVKYVQS